ncbi:hypothetical protein MJM59_29270, partial [Salmonella enterica subsp. enterica serovar Montevideo]|nr:hypothetical protein [Salmonella enterica subsp. enterica serovar Montevideo]
LPRLQTVLFQQQLGTLRDKTDRIQALAGWIAGQIGADVNHATLRNITAIEVVKPAIGQSATAYMGDPIITSATGFKTDVLELGAA